MKRIETNNTIEPGFWYPVSLEFLQDVWIPNIFIYNLKGFENISVLKKLAGIIGQITIQVRRRFFKGVWIINGKDVFYNQFTTVTFMCPMRFEHFPLDEHICKFRVGSTNMDINYMRFGDTTLGYDDSSRTTVLEYKVDARKLKKQDRMIQYAGQNYSVTGRK